MDATTKRLVPLPEACRVLGDIGRTTIYELVNHGEICKVNVGSRSFITADSLAAYVERLIAIANGSSANAEDTAVAPDDAGDEEYWNEAGDGPRENTQGLRARPLRQSDADELR